jgi:hypothetical protein
MPHCAHRAGTEPATDASGRRKTTRPPGRSVVGEDACVCHHTGADAPPVADPELRGGAPAHTDCIVLNQRMFAGRAKICGSDVDVNESGRSRVHIESVRPGSRAGW